VNIDFLTPLCFHEVAAYIQTCDAAKGLISEYYSAHRELISVVQESANVLEVWEEAEAWGEAALQLPLLRQVQSRKRQDRNDGHVHQNLLR
jgi:hypothetical protein